jgi:hypothetical protein
MNNNEEKRELKVNRLKKNPIETLRFQNLQDVSILFFFSSFDFS